MTRLVADTHCVVFHMSQMTTAIFSLSQSNRSTMTGPPLLGRDLKDIIRTVTSRRSLAPGPGVQGLIAVPDIPRKLPRPVGSSPVDMDSLSAILYRLAIQCSRNGGVVQPFDRNLTEDL